MAKSYLVGRRDEFTEGGRKVVSCDGTEIVVFLIDGKLEFDTDAEKLITHPEAAHA